MTLLADGSLEYTPDLGFVGDDSFEYRVTDDNQYRGTVDEHGEPLSAPGPNTDDATVTLHVGAPPPPGVPGAWAIQDCDGSLGAPVWSFWPDGAVVQWEAHQPLGPGEFAQVPCRTSYEAGEIYTVPFASWSLDPQGRLVVTACTDTGAFGLYPLPIGSGCLDITILECAGLWSEYTGAADPTRCGCSAPRGCAGCQPVPGSPPGHTGGIRDWQAGLSLACPDRSPQP